MSGVLLAELAILLELDAVGRILFVFVRPVVAIFAFGAGQGNIRPHDSASQKLFQSPVSNTGDHTNNRRVLRTERREAGIFL